MFAVFPGDIVFSKIDARSGAIGVLPSGIEKAVVTTEFPVFIPDADRLDGQFVRLALRTGNFLAGLRRRATGTSGRKRITTEDFLDLHIPLPSLDEQQAIVAAYETALARASDLERKAMELEAAAIRAFETALGFAPATPLPDRPIFVADFRDIDRWSYEGILRHRVDGDGARKPIYPFVHLRDVIADLENGWSPKCLDRPAEEDEWGVLKLGAVSFGTFDQQQNKALPKHLTPRPDLEVKRGQVLISRANVTRLVGATALIGNTRQRLMLCDKIFRVVWPDPSPVDPAFLTEVLRVADVRRQIEAKVTGTSPTMKNISKPSLLSLRFPLPPIVEQSAIVNELTSARSNAASQFKEAAETRARAWIGFEKAIYASIESAKKQITVDQQVGAA